MESRETKEFQDREKGIKCVGKNAKPHMFEMKQYALGTQSEEWIVKQR